MAGSPSGQAPVALQDVPFCVSALEEVPAPALLPAEAASSCCGPQQASLAAEPAVPSAAAAPSAAPSATVASFTTLSLEQPEVRMHPTAAPLPAMCLQGLHAMPSTSSWACRLQPAELRAHDFQLLFQTGTAGC